MYDSYARLSKNLSGLLEKVEDQHADNEAVIEAAGGRLGLRLTDNSLSAWDPTVYREGWERLLARVESGESDGCAVWNTDRLLRLPADLEKLIELGRAGYRVLSSHGARNLADYSDRYILRQDAASAAKASDQASERIRFRFANQRRRGVLHRRGRSFGFGGEDHRLPATYDEDGKRIPRPPVPGEVVAREREALREATRAILVGDGTASVARSWNESGLLTTTGKQWTLAQVREVLLRARNAGLVEHNGEIVGQVQGEPIVPESEFHRLRALFAGRRRGRRAGWTHLASGVLRCGACGKPMTGRPHTGVYREDGAPRRQYACATARGGCGSVAADARGVERALRELVIMRRSDPEHAAWIERERRVGDDRRAELDREIGECETLGEQLAGKLGRRELTLAAYDAAVEPLNADLDRLRAERDALPDPRAQAVADGAASRVEAEAEWDSATVIERRALLGYALGGTRVVLDPASRKGARFDPDRLRLANGPA